MAAANCRRLANIDFKLEDLLDPSASEISRQKSLRVIVRLARLARARSWLPAIRDHVVQEKPPMTTGMFFMTPADSRSSLHRDDFGGNLLA
jgi:hypothetical protein